MEEISRSEREPPPAHTAQGPRVCCRLPRAFRSVPYGTNKCRLSWLTNSALVYESKCGGEGGGVARSQPMSTVQLYTGAQINFEDLTSYLTYVRYQTNSNIRCCGTVMIYCGSELRKFRFRFQVPVSVSVLDPDQIFSTQQKFVQNLAF